MSQVIINPFQNYLDIDGSPLQNGNLYIGQPNQVAQAAPLTVYYDRALTQPAAQPLLIMNGNVMRAGTPANIFFSGTDYSITVQRQDGTQVYTILSAVAAGYVDEAITIPTLAVQNDNIIQNSNFEVNTLGVSGTVVLIAGEMGHDLWIAGTSGCTYSFLTIANVTTITISSGTLKQIVSGTLLYSGSYYLGWTGTAQARINTGAYGIPRVVSLTGGADTTFEFGAGTVSQIQATISTSAIVWKPSNNIFKSDQAADSSYFNQLVNSGFFINQDSYLTNGSPNVLTANQIGFDCWRAGAAGCTFTYSNVNGIRVFTITAGSLFQNIALSQLVSGSYMLQWGGTSQALVNAITYGQQAVLTLTNGAGVQKIEFGTGTLWQPQLKQGVLITPYVPEPYTVAFLRCQSQRTYFTFSNTSYNAAAGNNITSLNFPVPMVQIPSYVQITAPTYFNSSGFVVQNITQLSCNQKFITTAAGNAQCTVTFSMDATW